MVPKVSSRELSPNSRSSPITQVCQSLSRLYNAERSYSTRNSSQEHNMVTSTSVESPENVKLVKVKQAWAASPEAATSVEVVRRRKKSEPGGGFEPGTDQRNLNVINNNNNGSSEGADLNLKRRSYHPQDYLSQVLEPTTSENTIPSAATSSRLKRKDFPKVNAKIIQEMLHSKPKCI